MSRQYDKIIIGAGLYGLYAALYSARKGESVLVMECDKAPFSRATYINQARVHMGYHYPRSLSTAVKSAGYFRRFVEDFGFCIHKDFAQIYATSDKFSWTSAEQFEEFCHAAGIKCEEVAVSKYFKKGACDGAFLTEEYTYDARLLGQYYLEQLSAFPRVSIAYSTEITSIVKGATTYQIYTTNGEVAEAAFVLNATYASVNQVLNKVEGLAPDKFGIKYELCEIILTRPSEALQDTVITVMDGPFFSIMPFGKTGYHSLTAVTFTPHVVSYDEMPAFSCQKGVSCSRNKLENCDSCAHRPDSAWPYMSHLADKYMKEQYQYQYVKSLFSMKPILKSSEVDDSRPTAIKVASEQPTLISVLSGKINTVYDLDQYL